MNVLVVVTERGGTGRDGGARAGLDAGLLPRDAAAARQPAEVRPNRRTNLTGMCKPQRRVQICVMGHVTQLQ